MTAASLAVQEKRAFIFIFATDRRQGSAMGEMNEDKVPLWGLRSRKTDVGGHLWHRVPV